MSDLCKIENGIEIVEKKHNNINISDVTGSSININSNGAKTNISQIYSKPPVFAEMINAIKAENFESDTESMLINNTQLLASSHGTGIFKEVYKDFMQNVSAHITVFTPFISSLSGLL